MAEGIPSTTDMHLPVLEIIADGELHEITEVVKSVAERMGVTDKAREITTRSGSRSFYSGVRRAVSNLRIAGLLENEVRGMFGITSAGSDVMDKRPASIDMRYLRENCEPYRRHESDRKKSLESLRKGRTAVGPHEQRGLVAMIDVLGVRGSWREKKNNGGMSKLHENWNGLLGSARNILKDNKTLGKKMTFTAFSDTMFITVKGDDYEGMLLSFSKVMWRIIVTSIREDVPLRGCVSCGGYFHSRNNLFTGPAVDEAAAYYSLPQWIGISAAPSANGVLSRAMLHPPYLDGGVYKRHNIPLKASIEQDAWALNWPKQCEYEDDEGAMEKIVEHIDERMEGLTDIGAALKWRNTRKFCNEVQLDDLYGRAAG